MNRGRNLPLTPQRAGNVLTSQEASSILPAPTPQLTQLGRADRGHSTVLPPALGGLPGLTAEEAWLARQGRGLGGCRPKRGPGACGQELGAWLHFQ